MQTLLIFWSSWRLEMVVSERQHNSLLLVTFISMTIFDDNKVHKKLNTLMEIKQAINIAFLLVYHVREALFAFDV